MTERFVAGVVSAPFGVKGHLKVHSLSGETEHLESLKTVVLRVDGAERTYVVEEARPVSAGVVLKFVGVDSPEAAKSLQGAELVVDREHAAPLDEGEYYIEDLRGVRVLLPDGEDVGEIRDILEGGAGQLIEVKTKEGASRLVPFRDEFFGDIDPEGRRAVLKERWILE